MCFQVHAFPHKDEEEIEEYCFGRRCDDGKQKMERVVPKGGIDG